MIDDINLFIKGISESSKAEFLLKVYVDKEGKCYLVEITTPNKKTAEAKL